MQVYYHGRSLNHRIFVTPAHDYPNVNSWREEDGRGKQFEVHFKNGVADVDDNLGLYMIEKGLVSKTKIITDHKEVA